MEILALFSVVGFWVVLYALWEGYHSRIRPKNLFVEFDALEYTDEQIKRIAPFTSDVIVKTINVPEGRNTIQQFVVQLVDREGRDHDATKPLLDESVARELAQKVGEELSKQRSKQKMIS